MRNSRESLRGSRESLHGSMENISLNDSPKSSSLPRDCPPPTHVPLHISETCPSTLNKHDKPHRKMLRRAISAITGQDSNKDQASPQPTDPYGRNSKTLSMITGSSESLPSMPEEEEIAHSSSQADGSSSQTDAASPGGEKKFVWTPVPVNTHLMSRHSRFLPSYQSMTDLRLTEEEVKRRKKLANVMREMVHTERDYVRSLQFVIDHYMPLLERDDVPQALRGKRNIIFGNLEKIYQFHNHFFLKEVENCQNSPFLICQSFLKHASDFYLYALYNKNKPRSDELMAEVGSSFFKRKQLELGDRMDLSSYLLKPVQRMGKYALLLKQIIGECPEQEPEHADLRAAFEMVRFQLRHGNDLLAMDSLKQCDFNLQEQGRLLRQEEFLVWQGRKKSMRRVFLFEDLLVFSKAKRNSSGHEAYIYKSSIKTSDMGLTENIGDSGFKFEIWFRKRTTRASFILQAPNIDLKKSWTREISRLLWKQAIKNRELRHAEMAKMGVGSKPCLDLKVSKNNISDRFVNVTTSSQETPRSRNSIAVCSADHLKNGNKRPHSIISVSSASSSGSSQSSGQNILNMTSGGGITLDSLLEETREAHRQVSQSFTSFNESGIGTDMSQSQTSVTSEDACTQTTLKRPPKKSLTLTSDLGSEVASDSSHLFSTDV